MHRSHHPTSGLVPRPFVRFILALTLFLALVADVSAATVRGTLSTATAGVGEDVIYELEINGGAPDRLPTFPKLDGVEVTFGGRSSSTTIINGNVKQSVTYRYGLMPQREGPVEIPPVEVIVDGVHLSTQALTLKVSQPEKTVGAGDFAFGEIRITRKPAYVGEDVVVELRYYFDAAAARWSLSSTQLPAFEGDGYASRPMEPGDQSEAELAGKKYARLLFRTVITPNRAGKISLGPVPIKMLYSKRMGAPNDRFGAIYEKTRQLSVSAPALELEVKPLPVEGRPKDFAGAIGTFRFSGQGTPNRVKVGEPVSMTLRVDGQGNFDRIGAPVLADPTGWRSYPATDKFEGNDRLSVNGRKTFEIAVVPETKKTALPVFNFCYFDPEKAKYVTLTNQPDPLVVEGGDLPAPGPVLPGTTLPAPPKPEDILEILPAPGLWSTGWNPRPLKWFALLFAPAPVIGLLLYWRARRTDPRVAIRAALVREKSELMLRVRSATERTELFDAAARVLQIGVALSTGRPAGGIDEATVLNRSDSPAVRKMYAARAELVYAGETGGKATTMDRDLVMDALEEFERKRR